MDNQEIKEKRDLYFEQIKTANEGLKRLRAFCPHESTFVGNYEWRVGSIAPANICAYCGEVVGFAKTEPALYEY